MGTLAAFTFYAPPEKAQAAAKAAQTEFERIIAIANLYDPQSELSRLNASAYHAPFACSDDLWILLQEARQAYEFSGGAFDITAKPLMLLWGFYRKQHPGKLPTQTEIDAARANVGLDKVEFDDENQTVRFTRPGMAIDLGGIAKGYAVDLAAHAAEEQGIRRGVIDLGGNLRLLQPPPGLKFYKVGIRDPRKRDQLTEEVLELVNTAVSTSGDYERFIEIAGKKYGHIMDPATGLPAHHDYSVTVTAPSALLADWLSTTLYLRPELAPEFPGVTIHTNRP